MGKGRVTYNNYEVSAFKIGMTIYSVYKGTFSKHRIMRIDKDGFILDGFYGSRTTKKFTEMGLTNGTGVNEDFKRVFFFSKIYALNESKEFLERALKEIDIQIDTHKKQFLENIEKFKNSLDS